MLKFLFEKVLTRPVLSNKAFPYHIKTNQLSPASFPHHKEDEGGNTTFQSSFELVNMFSESSSKKYVENSSAETTVESVSFLKK